MAKINIKEFILLLDGAQDEDTNIIINVNGEEIASGTLNEAINEIENCDINSNIIVKSFMFCTKNLIIECGLMQ